MCGSVTAHHSSRSHSPSLCICVDVWLKCSSWRPAVTGAVRIDVALVPHR